MQHRRGRNYKGPRLPGHLARELEGDIPAAFSLNHRGRGGHFSRPTSGSKRPRSDNTNTDHKVRRPPPPIMKKKEPASSPASHFNELLRHSSRDHRAHMVAELELQRTLARKLGLRKGKTSLGGDDGLDDLLQEMGGIEELFDNDTLEKETQGLTARATQSSLDSSSDDDVVSEEDKSVLEEEDGDDDDDDGNSELDNLSDALLNTSSSEEERDYDSDSEGGDAKKPLEKSGKYIPPARKALQTPSTMHQSEQLIRKVRGLLNRLSESNIQGIVAELGNLYEFEGRRLVSDAVCDEFLSTAAEGPRATKRFAGIVAATIAGIAAASRAQELIANFLNKLAVRLESATQCDDVEEGTCESSTRHNLVLVVAYLYVSGALHPDIVFSLLNHWKSRFLEADLAMMSSLLNACGLAVRAADPVSMKEFVVGVHVRAAEAGNLSKRAEIMLELVVDIKNNRKKENNGGALPPFPLTIKKWLNSVCVADVALGGLTWDTILTTDRKGRWWLPLATDMKPTPLPGSSKSALQNVEMSSEHKESLLPLAAKMRMNTDARRAVFLVVMGSEDCIDAHEKLLRLNLKGDQEREIVRVIIECCLQERSWNAYYPLLLSRLVASDRNQRLTLQYALWDQIKEVEKASAATLTMMRTAHLAQLLAKLVSDGAFPASGLKAIDFKGTFSVEYLLFWRIVFENIFWMTSTDSACKTVFDKLTAQPKLMEFRKGLHSFVRGKVGPWLASFDPGQEGRSSEYLATVLKRCRIAEKCLQ